MPTFKYRAVGPAGGIDTGTLTARDVAAAQRQLRSKKMTPLSVTATIDSAAGSASDVPRAGTTPDIETARALLDKVSAKAKPARNGQAHADQWGQESESPLSCAGSHRATSQVLG